MFISSAEKESIAQAISTLQNKVRDLEIEVVWMKNRVSNKRSAIVTSDDAPWGFKRDGNPRKRPGRPPQFMEVSV